MQGSTQVETSLERRGSKRTWLIFPRSRLLSQRELTALRTFDLSRIIGIYTAGSILLDQSTKTPVEVCYDEEKIERILLNNLSAPTEDFPVALVADDIQVFPTSIRKIEVRYYKIPEGRTLAGARTTSMPNYTSGSGKIDFELPDHYVSDLVYEIGKMIGLNLRDQQVVAYTGQEMQTRKQAETF